MTSAKHLSRFELLSILLLTLGLSIPAQAQTVPPPGTPHENGHRIDFSYQEATELDNDLMVITFAAIAEGENSATVSARINRMMQQAKNILQNAPLESIQTENYHVSPVYNKARKIDHWRGQQTLKISAKTDQPLDKVLQKMQQHLAFQNMQFTLSKERRQKAQEALLKTAIQGYRQKAKMLAEGFGHSDFKFLQTNVQPRYAAPVMRYNAMAMEKAVAAAPAPYTEQGSSSVQVQLRGTLLLPY